MITIFLSPPRFNSCIKKSLFILIVVVLAIGGRGHGTLREVQYIIKKNSPESGTNTEFIKSRWVYLCTVFRFVLLFILFVSAARAGTRRMFGR